MSLLNPKSGDIGSPAGSLARPASSRPEIDLLRKAGIIKTPDSIEGHFIDILHEVGASPHQILARIASIMDSGESDGVRLAAARDLLKLYMHPAVVSTKVKEETQRPAIIFNIQSPQVNMQNVLAPDGGIPQNPESW